MSSIGRVIIPTYPQIATSQKIVKVNRTFFYQHFLKKYSKNVPKEYFKEHNCIALSEVLLWRMRVGLFDRDNGLIILSII